jgi:hypothetical protein
VNPSMNGDYEEALRRALHAAADSIEPSADGLERIRERLNRPMLSFEAASAWSAGTAAWLRRVMEPVVAAFWAVIDRFRPAPAKAGHARPRYNWIRPVAGMGIAVFVVAAGAFALKTLPQAISPSSSSSAQGSAAGGNAPGTGTGGGANGGRSQDAAGAQPTEGGHHTAGVTPAAKPCPTTPKPGKSATGSVSPSPSTSAPAGSTSPPVSGAPSSPPPASVSPTTTPDPGASGSGAPVSSPAAGKATADSSAAACASKAPPKKATAPKTAPPASSPPASVSSSVPASSAPAKSGGTTIGGTSGGTSTAPAAGAST